MRKKGKILGVSMFFLLLWLVMPIDDSFSQKYMAVSKTFHFEQAATKSSSNTNSHEGNISVPISNQYELNNLNNGTELPANFIRKAEFISDKRKQSTYQKAENYLQLSMDGMDNDVVATQKNGSNNIMNLGVAGNRNTGNYLQNGSKNYIYDRIKGNEIRHEISQKGNQLGIHNQGMQKLPLIIEQRGTGMKLLIKGGPN